MAAKYVCKRCGKEMFSLVEVVEDWNDIYCKACNPEASPPGHSRRARTAYAGAPAAAHLPDPQAAVVGGGARGGGAADVPDQGRRRAAPQGADVPPLATPAWDAERALAALNVTEVPFDATNE